MRVLIVDDEAPARAKLRRLLDEAADVEVVGEASTGRQAVAMIRHSLPDVVFLDIMMPGLDGFGVIDALGGDSAPYIVFVTAFDEHALRAFEVGAADYLLKPFSPARFAVTLERAHERVAEQARAARPAPQREVADAPPLTRIFVERDGRAVFLNVDRIDRLEADRNYVKIFAGDQQFRIRAPLTTVERRLDPTKFTRLNRGTVVRFDAIRDMVAWSHGDYRVTLHDGVEVIWSRRYRAVAERIMRRDATAR